MPYDPNYVPVGDNNRSNPYYQKINHVRIPRNASNRTTFLTAFDGGLQPNGGFEHDTDGWVFAPEWRHTTRNGGMAEAWDNGSDLNKILRSTVTWVPGRTYRISWSLVEISVGRIRPQFSGSVGVFRTVVGDYIDELTPNNDELNFVGQLSFVGAIDNVNVTDITPVNDITITTDYTSWISSLNGEITWSILVDNIPFSNTQQVSGDKESIFPSILAQIQSTAGLDSVNRTGNSVTASKAGSLLNLFSIEYTHEDDDPNTLFGPFQSQGVMYWIDTFSWTMGFDIDADPDPDVFAPIDVFLSFPGINQQIKDDVIAQAEQLGWEP